MVIMCGAGGNSPHGSQETKEAEGLRLHYLLEGHPQWPGPFHEAPSLNALPLIKVAQAGN